MNMITWWFLPRMFSEMSGMLKVLFGILVNRLRLATLKSHAKADVRKLFGWLEDYVDLPNQRSRTALSLKICFISYSVCFLYFFVDMRHDRVCLSGHFWKDLGRHFVRRWNGLAWAFGDVFETGVLSALVSLVSWFYKGKVFQPWMLVKTFRAKTSVVSVVLPLIEVIYCYDRSARSMVE